LTQRREDFGFNPKSEREVQMEALYAQMAAAGINGQCAHNKKKTRHNSAQAPPPKEKVYTSL